MRTADIVGLQQKIDDMKGLRTAEVRRLAVLAGAVEAQLDAADEAPDTRAALIDWIIAKEIAVARVQPPTAHVASAIVTTDAVYLGTSSEHGAAFEPEIEESEDDRKRAGLRTKLVTLQVSELKREALALGVEQSQLDVADDAESPKEAIIELVVGKEMESFAGAQTMQVRVEVLRGELLALRVSELKRRALGAGVAQSQMDESDDNEGGPKAALVECIISMEMSATKEGDGGAFVAAERARVEKLRGELLALRVSELKQRALGAGVAQSEIDEADDNEGGPKAALADLIVSNSNCQGGGGGSGRSWQPEAKPEADTIADPNRQSRPHFGAPSGVAKTTATEPPGASKAKVAAQHAMLSYSWNSQSKVVAARKQLGEHGIKCWMDIDGDQIRPTTPRPDPQHPDHFATHSVWGGVVRRWNAAKYL